MKKLISIFLTCIIISSLFTLPVLAQENNKYDVLKILNIMVGDEDGDMRLQDKVTRAEFTKLASEISSYRKSIPHEQKTSPFSDVTFKHWASAYVKAGVENGIISGYPDSTFKPENNVTYAEALTILLRILGYTDSDFGDSYPYGQYSLADSIEITNGINVDLNKEITREEAAKLLLNTLETKFKNNNFTPYSSFDAQKIEDIVILATSTEDASLTTDKISTTAGIFKFNKGIENFVGSKGDAIIKDGDTIIYFEPEDELNDITKYVVYSCVSDGIIVYKNGIFSQINIENNTIAYFNSQPTTFAALKNSLTIGDSISVKKDLTGNIEYITVYKGNLDGPYIYSSSNLLLSQIPDINEYLILKNGDIVDNTNLVSNDVYYFSKDLKIMLVYDTKITGIYNKAIPNQEVPISVEISGNIYEIEGGEAFALLSSAGKFKYGDSVTILLGLDRKVAGVVSSDTVKSKNVGYILDAGIKNYTSTTDKLQSQYFVSVVMPNGENIEYKTKRDYESYKNSISEIEFDGELATLTRLTTGRENNSKVTGTFNYDSLTIGNYMVSKNVQILDVSTIDDNEPALFKTVQPQRINGVKLTTSNILYYELNEKNAITKLIIKDVTGDYYNYGIVTKVEKNSEMMFGAYEFILSGNQLAYQTQNSIFGVNRGPARIKRNGNSISSMQNISMIKDKITEISHTFVSTSKSNYLLAENVEVYYRNNEYDYMLIDINDIINSDDYSIQGAYYDKSQSSGGRVRIIVVTKKNN